MAIRIKEKDTHRPANMGKMEQKDMDDLTTVNMGVSISRKALDGLTECAKKYRTSRSHIADLVFVNLHKLRLVDIVEDFANDQRPVVSVPRSVANESNEVDTDPKEDGMGEAMDVSSD